MHLELTFGAPDKTGSTMEQGSEIQKGEKTKKSKKYLKLTTERFRNETIE